MKPSLILLRSYISPLLLQRLTPESSEKIYELEDVVKSFDDLQKATRSAYQLSSSQHLFGFLVFGFDVAWNVGVDAWRFHWQNAGEPPEGAEGAL